MADNHPSVALLDQLPGVDIVEDRKTGKKNPRGTYTGPKWEDATKLFEQVLAGGKDSIVGIISLLHDTDDGQDYKARYMLHGLVVFAGASQKEGERNLLVRTFVAELGGQRAKGVKAFLIRELQWIGDKGIVTAIAPFLTDEELYADAANALIAIKDGAVEQFRAALPKAQGRAKASIVQALGRLQDAQAIQALQGATADEDADTRIVARWALANIGDEASIDPILKGTAAEGWERIQGVKAGLVLAEKLLAAGKKAGAARIYTRLRGQPEEYVQKIATERLSQCQ